MMTKKIVRLSREAVAMFFRDGYSYKIKKGIDKEDMLLGWKYDVMIDQFILIFGQKGDPELIGGDDWFPVLETLPETPAIDLYKNSFKRHTRGYRPENSIGLINGSVIEVDDHSTMRGFPRVRTTPDESYGNCSVCNKPRTSDRYSADSIGYCGCVGYCDCQDASDT